MPRLHGKQIWALFLSRAYGKALWPLNNAKESYLCGCLHERGWFIHVHHLQKHARKPGKSAHLMNMVTMVSVAMPVLLSMLVPLIAFMVRMHAVLGPHGLQNVAQDYKVNAEYNGLNKAISITGF